MSFDAAVEDEWGDDFVSEDELKFEQKAMPITADPAVVGETFQLMLEEDKRAAAQIAEDEKLALNMIVDEHEVRRKPPVKTYASVLRPPPAATAAVLAPIPKVAPVKPAFKYVACPPRSTRASRRHDRRQAELINAALSPSPLEGIRKKLLAARSIIDQALAELATHAKKP